MLKEVAPIEFSSISVELDFLFCYKAEAYSKPARTIKMELSEEIVKGWKPLNIFAKNFIIDVPQSSEYTSIKDD